MLTLSPMGASAGTSAAASFSTGTDSPVSAASCTLRFTDSSSLRSAGTLSPVSTETMSPTTSSRDSMTLITPSLITLQWGADIFSSASSDFSALDSWSMPIIALATSITSMIRASVTPSPLMYPVTPDMIAATMSTIIMKLLNWLMNFWKRVVCLVFSNSL